MAAVSAEPYASHLHLAPDRYPCQHLITQEYETTLKKNEIAPSDWQSTYRLCLQFYIRSRSFVLKTFFFQALDRSVDMYMLAQYLETQLTAATYV